MITEDYCSFKLSKLLKEKGFDVPCLASYHIEYPENNPVWSPKPVNDVGWMFMNAPTHQMARRWLLQKHELFICVVQTLDLEGNVVYIPTIWKNALYIERASKDNNSVFKSDKDAVEVALYYCLTELV